MVLIVEKGSQQGGKVYQPPPVIRIGRITDGQSGKFSVDFSEDAYDASLVSSSIRIRSDGN